MEIYRETRSEAKRRHLTKAAASVALFAVLTGCASEREPAAPRNSPASAEYSLDANPTYYQDIQNISKHTQDTEVLTKLSELASTPVAQWLHGDKADVHATLQATLEKSKAAGTVPVLVAYNIPNRDLNNFSGGGSNDAAAYKEWITDISQTIGESPSVVILEPDALPHLRDLDDQQANERVELLANAIDTLHANPNTAVYLDAGNSGWISPEDTAELLKKVDEKTEHTIPGISLNVSNYLPEDQARAYAEKIQDAYGQELYIMIDNSRNGAPGAIQPGEWCNPEGQKLGTIDSRYDRDAKVEVAFIKTPGQSDGVCGISQVPAGEFDGELLFRQLKG
jgi:endoglucanase